MKIVETILATTRVDRHGDLFTKEALYSGVPQARTGYIPVLFNHDPRIPPLGRTVDARVCELPDRNHALVGIAEIFEPGDQIPLCTEREIVIQTLDQEKITVLYDRSYRSEEDQAILTDLAHLELVSVEAYEKKALEPLSVLLIGIGGSFAAGFFGKMGSDLWDYLKPRVIQLVRRRRKEKREHLVLVELQLHGEGGLLSVQCILTNPTDEELRDFWTVGVALLKRQLPTLLQLGPEVRRVVLHYANSQFVPGFAVRKDCVPLKLEIKPPVEGGEE